MERIVYLYNPLSNQGKLQKDWQQLTKKHPQLAKNAFALSEIADLTKFLKQQLPEIVVIAGGDGTINRVCQSVLQLAHKPKLSILPLGSGNAMSYCFGVETMERALFVADNPTSSVTIDIMKTNLEELPIGIFNISAGFDARVVHNRNTPGYIGFRSYLLSALQSFVFHPQSEITFTIDHEVKLSALASSLMVANGPLIGYNYLVAPESKLNDGLLDCTLFSTKYAYLTNMRLKGFRHPLYSKMGKVHFKASHLKIEGEPYLQIDGDPVQKREGLEISLLKKQLTFLYHKDLLALPESLPFLLKK